MIPTNPNPKMTAEEVRIFREKLCTRMNSRNSPEVLRERAEIARTANKIVKNNGGKNPIL